MEIDPTVTAIIVSSVTTLIVTFGGRWLSRRMERSESEAKESDAARTLSEAAKTQINTYNEEVVEPLRQRINGLEGENQTLRKLLLDETTRYESYRRTAIQQIEDLQSKVKNLNVSLESQREQIVILIQQSESKDKTIRRMQEEIDQLRRENESLREQINRLESENDALKTRPVGDIK